MSGQIILSTAGPKGLPAVLVADRENLLAVMGIHTPQGELTVEVFFEVSSALKASLSASLTKSAEAVEQSMASHVCLPHCRDITASPAARLWGSLWRLALNRPHILKQAAAKLDGGLLVGVRTIEKGGLEVIFENGLLEGLLNANGKKCLVDWLRRAARVVEIQGGSRK